MPRRHCLADRAAGGMADDMRSIDIEMIHEGEHVIGHLIDGVSDRRSGALARAAVVVNDDAIRCRKCCNIRQPVIAETAETGDQQQRGACAVRLVIDVTVDYRRDRHGHPPDPSVARGPISANILSLGQIPFVWQDARLRAPAISPGRGLRSRGRPRV